MAVSEWQRLAEVSVPALHLHLMGLVCYISVLEYGTTLRISYVIHIAVMPVIPSDNGTDFRLETEVVLDHSHFLPECRYRSKPRRSQTHLPCTD